VPLFGRRNDPGTDPAELDLTGPWSVSEGSYEGRPLIVRRNTGIEGLAGAGRERIPIRG
jgi:hypothetical protein